MVSDRLQVMTLRVITSVSGSSSAAGAVGGELLHDVALRHDADDAPVGAGHDQRADCALGEKLGRSGQVRRWARW